MKKIYLVALLIFLFACGTESTESKEPTDNGDTTPPTAPTLTITELEESLKLSWTASTDENLVKYHIIGGESSGATNVVKVITDLSVLEYTISNLEDGKPYFYSVKAIDKSNLEGISNEASGTPLKDQTAPQDITIGDVFRYDGRFEVNWTGDIASDFDRFVFYVGTDPANLTVAKEIANRLYVKTEILGLTNDVKHYVKITLKDKNGNESAGASFEVTPTVPSQSLFHISDAEFQNMVIDSDKLVIVDFWATWCGPCAMIKPHLDEIAKKYWEKVVVVKIDTDDHSTRFRSYGLSSLPSVLYFKGGNEKERVIGAYARDHYFDLVKKNL